MYLSKVFAIGAVALFTSTNAGVIPASRDAGMIEARDVMIEARDVTASQVKVKIQAITDLSGALEGTVGSLGFVDVLLAVIGLGNIPQIVINFTTLLSTIVDDVTLIQGIKPFTIMADEQSIVAVLIIFVKIHQALLSTLIGKAGLIRYVPVIGIAVANLLSELEGIVDGFALALIELVPDGANDVKTQTDALKTTCQSAVTAYTS